MPRLVDAGCNFSSIREQRERGKKKPKAAVDPTRIVVEWSRGRGERRGKKKEADFPMEEDWDWKGGGGMSENLGGPFREERPTESVVGWAAERAILLPFLPFSDFCCSLLSGDSPRGIRNPGPLSLSLSLSPCVSAVCKGTAAYK